MGPKTALITSFIVGFLAICCTAYFSVESSTGKLSPQKKRRLKILARDSLIIFVLAVGSLGGVLTLSVSPSGGKIVVVFDKNNAVIQTSDRPIWKPKYYALITPSIEVAGKVQPITENPKVRKLEYKMEAEISDPSRYFATIGFKNSSVTDADVNQAKFHEAVGYQVYEFNNAHSKELARFYNPLDAKQRTDLETLIKTSMNPALEANGIRVTRLVSFSVE